MAYDKPKITIDLDEYNDLKKREQDFNSDEYVVAAKKVIAAFITARFNFNQTAELLKRDGIKFVVSGQSAVILDENNIFIEKLTPKQ